ncbi:MAG: TonB-dependent receptor [Sphingomonadaceae bacterium]
MNARLGFTPAEDIEIALSYTRQEGAKNAPLETTFPLPVQRFWAWPEWNLETIALHARAPLGESARLMGHAYRSRFDNLLRAFDTRAQTTQTLPRAFNSQYEDQAIGGFLRLDLDLAERHALGIAVHVRQDEHVEYQQSFPSGFVEPPQTSRESTYSVAAEHRWQLAPAWQLRLGGSYDWRDLHRAEEYGVPPGGGPATLFAYPRRNGDAWNGQAQLQWQPDAGSRLALSLSSRARFPTLFERFSSRFGGAAPNPGLGAERATQVEMAGAHATGRVRLEGAVTADLAPGFRAGASLSFVRRDIADPGNPAFRPTGVPDVSGFLWAEWALLPGFLLLPSLDVAGDRWLVNTPGTRWRRDGAHALVNLRLAWRPLPGVELAVSASNLTDANFQLAEGFPEQSRNFRLSARLRS